VVVLLLLGAAAVDDVATPVVSLLGLHLMLPRLPPLMLPYLLCGC
jgi:hypothetical protein